jgi:hypothetical protein
VQLGEGVLLAVVLIVIVLLASNILANRHLLTKQVAINTQQRLRLAAVIAAQQSEQRRITSALCDNQYTIATVTIPPPGTKILTQYIESSRKAFTILQCPGRLGPPPTALLRAGKRWNVPIRY